MPKIISSVEAASQITSGSSVMFGGFLAVGSARDVIDEIVKSEVKDLHLICIASDTETTGVGKLIANNQIKSAQVSHLGTNKTMQAQMNSGQVNVEIVPQGTLMERIRAGGAGLGGILTPTGLGTAVAEGKQILKIDDKDYLLETAIKSDFAVIKAHKADKNGNLVYYKTARNSNPIMATAATITIVEVDEIVETGELSAENIVTPGIFVDFIVQTKGDK